MTWYALIEQTTVRTAYQEYILHLGMTDECRSRFTPLCVAEMVNALILPPMLGQDIQQVTGPQSKDNCAAFSTVVLGQHISSQSCHSIMKIILQNRLIPTINN